MKLIRWCPNCNEMLQLSTAADAEKICECGAIVVLDAVIIKYNEEGEES